jgi:hypothetical protein
MKKHIATLKIIALCLGVWAAGFTSGIVTEVLVGLQPLRKEAVRRGYALYSSPVQDRPSLTRFYWIP